VVAADGDAHLSSVPSVSCSNLRFIFSIDLRSLSVAPLAVTVPDVQRDDELPRVTPSLLRRADAMCRRRLAREHSGGKPHANRTADARFAVSNRLEGDARLAQAEFGCPQPSAFVEPIDLEPEQRRFYRAAARGYLDFFGDVPGMVVDLGWATTMPQLGVVLTGNAGLPVMLDHGVHELRVLRFGGRRAGSPLLDTVDISIALLRTAEWADDNLRIVAADLLNQNVVEHIAVLPADRNDANVWLAGRVEAVTRAARDGRARAGSDCLGCPFVAGCDQHQG
jgi:hypothetical protein